MKKSTFNLSVFLFTVAYHIVLFALFYGKFGDFIIDSAREAVIPWRILEGHVLYKDIQYIYGPFAAYFLAFLYKVFGIHILVLQLTGLATSIAVSYLLFSLTNLFVNRYIAFLNSILFAFVCGFSNYFHKANIFNFIFPYSYSATFGILFLLLMLRIGFILLRTDHTRYYVYLGVFFALTALTKLELAMAAGLLVLLMPAAAYMKQFRLNRKGTNLKSALRKPCYCLLSASAILLPVFLYFSHHIDWLPYIFNEIVPVLTSPYFASLYGMDRIGANLALNLGVAAGYFALAGAFFIMDYLYLHKIKSSFDAKYHVVFIAAGILITIALDYIFLHHLIDFQNAFRCLNLFIIILIFKSAWDIYHRNANKGDFEKSLFLFCFSAACLAYSFRKFLTLDPTHYGFYIIVPYLVIYCVILFDLIPAFLSRFGAGRRFHTWGFSLLMILIALSFFQRSIKVYDHKQFDLKTHRGTFTLSKSRYDAMASLLDYFKGIPGRNFNLLVIPEGMYINYLLDSVPVIYYGQCLPNDVKTPEREEKFLHEIRSKNIEYIFVVSRRTSEHGYSVIGVDYFQQLYRFVQKNYRVVKTFGAPPFRKTNEFGVLLLQKKTF